jgi:hypothetical protein
MMRRNLCIASPEKNRSLNEPGNETAEGFFERKWYKKSQFHLREDRFGRKAIAKYIEHAYAFYFWVQGVRETVDDKAICSARQWNEVCFDWG